MPLDLNHKLHCEMMKGQLEMVRLLLNQGVDINHRNEHGNTPLHHAAEEGNEALIHLLLEQGADVHAVNNSGETVLWKAAHNHKMALIPLLLQAGAEPSFADAALLGDVEAGRKWIQAGADINSPIWSGVIPLKIACDYGHLDYVKMLIQAGVDIPELYPSLLHSAVFSGSFALLELLLGERDWDQVSLFMALTAAIYCSRRTKRPVYFFMEGYSRRQT